MVKGSSVTYMIVPIVLSWNAQNSTSFPYQLPLIFTHWSYSISSPIAPIVSMIWSGPYTRYSKGSYWYDRHSHMQESVVCTPDNEESSVFDKIQINTNL